MNKLIQTLNLAMAGLQAVDRLADDARVILDGQPATYDQLKTVVHTLAAIANAIKGGLSGDTEHVDALLELAKLRESIDRNNSTADAALDAKFPPGQ